MSVTSFSLCVIAALLSWPEPAPDNGNLLNLERMGAGVPSGWKIEQSAAEWQVETETGPLGPGAARLRLGDHGQVEFTSPARALHTGAQHVLMLWLRSEPPGARVSARLRDNNRDTAAGLEETVTAQAEWRPVAMECTPANSERGHYYLTFKVVGDNTTVWLDGLWWGERPATFGPDWKPTYRTASLTLSPEADWGVVTGDAPLRVKAHAANLPQDGQLCLRATQVNGTVTELPPGPVGEAPITLEGDAVKPYGMIRVEGVITNAAGQSLSPVAETLLARVPEPVPGPCPDSPFGIHVQLREPDITAMAKLGYKWCRIHDASGITKWGLIETSPGSWEWHDDQVDMVRRHGMSILGMIDSAPPWTTGTKETGYFSIYHAPKDLDLWRNYVRQVVGHYAGRIDEWEVWNEPWDLRRFFQGGSPGRYAELLKAAYQEAKATNPASTIVGVDTYLAIWESTVLASGAFPYYDKMSFHRYDPNLQGRPNDNLARVAQRLRNAQSSYGDPKPTLATEGGIDMTMFQGSFFSFADPAIVGNWSEGADRYARLFLSTIAAGHGRFIAYSVHNPPRHGMPNHMMCEPGPLVRPLHASLAALASFVEGAHYRERLIPAPDISAHVFEQPNTRPFAEAPSTIVTLVADGNASERLPRPLPTGIHCYDRWGNPAAVPVEATRAITYLVADTANAPAMLEALRTSNTEAGPQSVQELFQTTLRSIVSADPPLWRLFSVQGSLLFTPGANGVASASRAMLRDNHVRDVLPKRLGFLSLANLRTEPAGSFRIGSATIMANNQPVHTVFFTATQEGPENAWRYLTLAILPAGAAEAREDRTAVENLVNHWAQAIREGTSVGLHGLFHDDIKCVATCTLNGEYFVFDDPEYLITMMKTAMLFGKAPISTMTVQNASIANDMAAVTGRWDIASPPLGIGAYKFSALLHLTNDGWRLASFCMGL